MPEEREEYWQMEGNRLLFQTGGGMVNEALGEGSEGTEQFLSSATSLTPDRLLPAVLLLQSPSVSVRPQSQAFSLEALTGRSSHTVIV